MNKQYIVMTPFEVTDIDYGGIRQNHLLIINWHDRPSWKKGDIFSDQEIKLETIEKMKKENLIKEVN